MNFPYIKSISVVSTSLIMAASLTGCNPSGNPATNGEMTNTATTYSAPVPGTDYTAPTPEPAANTATP